MKLKSKSILLCALFSLALPTAYAQQMTVDGGSDAEKCTERNGKMFEAEQKKYHDCCSKSTPNAACIEVLKAEIIAYDPDTMKSISNGGSFDTNVPKDKIKKARTAYCGGGYDKEIARLEDASSQCMEGQRSVANDAEEESGKCQKGDPICDDSSGKAKYLDKDERNEES